MIARPRPRTLGRAAAVAGERGSLRVTLGGSCGGVTTGSCAAARRIIWVLASSWLGNAQAGEGKKDFPDWALQGGVGGNGPWVAACHAKGSRPSGPLTCQELVEIWAWEELHGGGGVAELERTHVEGSGKVGARNDSTPSRWMAWEVPARPMGRPMANDRNRRQANDFRLALGRAKQ